MAAPAPAMPPLGRSQSFQPDTGPPVSRALMSPSRAHLEEGMVVVKPHRLARTTALGMTPVTWGAASPTAENSPSSFAALHGSGSSRSLMAAARSGMSASMPALPSPLIRTRSITVTDNNLHNMVDEMDSPRLSPASPSTSVPPLSPGRAELRDPRAVNSDTERESPPAGGRAMPPAVPSSGSISATSSGMTRTASSSRLLATTGASSSSSSAPSDAAAAAGGGVTSSSSVTPRLTLQIASPTSRGMSDEDAAEFITMPHDVLLGSWRETATAVARAEDMSTKFKLRGLSAACCVDQAPSSAITNILLATAVFDLLPDVAGRLDGLLKSSMPTTAQSFMDVAVAADDQTTSMDMRARWLFVGSADGVSRRYEIDTCQCVGTYRLLSRSSIQHQTLVGRGLTALLVIPDFSAQALLLFNVVTGQQVRQVPTHASNITALTVIHGGLYAGFGDGRLAGYTIDTASPVVLSTNAKFVVTTHTRPVASVVGCVCELNPAQSEHPTDLLWAAETDPFPYIFVAGTDGTVRVFDPVALQVLPQSYNTLSPISTLHVICKLIVSGESLPVGIVCGCADGCVRVFNAVTGELAATVNSGIRPLLCTRMQHQVLLCGGGPLVATSASSHKRYLVTQLRLSTTQWAAGCVGHHTNITTLREHGSQPWVWTGDASGNVVCFDLLTQAPRASIRSTRGPSIMSALVMVAIMLQLFATLPAFNYGATWQPWLLYARGAGLVAVCGGSAYYAWVLCVLIVLLQLLAVVMGLPWQWVSPSTTKLRVAMQASSRERADPDGSQSSDDSEDETQDASTAARPPNLQDDEQPLWMHLLLPSRVRRVLQACLWLITTLLFVPIADVFMAALACPTLPLLMSEPSCTQPFTAPIVRIVLSCVCLAVHIILAFLNVRMEGGLDWCDLPVPIPHSATNPASWLRILWRQHRRAIADVLPVSLPFTKVHGSTFGLLYILAIVTMAAAMFSPDLNVAATTAQICLSMGATALCIARPPYANTGANCVVAGWLAGLALMYGVQLAQLAEPTLDVGGYQWLCSLLLSLIVAAAVYWAQLVGNATPNMPTNVAGPPRPHVVVW